MAMQGRQGMTKAMKKAARLAAAGTRKREKASQRGQYQREYNTRRAGYPAMGKKKNRGRRK